MIIKYRIVHSNMGYMPQVSGDGKEWANLAARPKFDYNEALSNIYESKCAFGKPEVVYEEDFDNGVPPKEETTPKYAEDPGY